MSVDFVHLHVHTEYSLVDGIVKINPLTTYLANQAMPAAAITDQMNMFAAVKFYKAAQAKGIKPIIGSDILIANPDDAYHPFHLLLLCQNLQGYKNLTVLISRAYQEGQDHGVAQIQYDWLTPDSTQGLIALSGGLIGDIGQAVITRQTDTLETRCQFWQRLFPDRFYLECQRIGMPKETLYNQMLPALANAFSFPIVATNAVRFLHQKDFEAHEARVCIHDARLLSDPSRAHRYSEQQYCRSSEEMQTLFSDMPQALQNSVEIAKRCNLELTLGKVFLPNFPIPAHQDEASFFSEQAYQGLEARLRVLFEGVDDATFAKKKEAYQARLQIELDVIIRMGFPGYFLIVADFIRWAKENKIPVGPGRGSGAGSLVAYVLGITDLDPIAYDLLFERFLNPERISMPDFDVDFCMEKRDLVIDYVAQTYGRDSVSQIITYGTMAARAVVRDVGRVLGLPYGFVDKVAKLIPFEIGITLEKALTQEVLLRERYEHEEEVTTLIDLAKKLEGVVRNVGKHAGGVVIAPTKLTDFAPLYCEAGGDNVVTQFDKDDIESVGLVKFDFLGLRTLTIIDWAVDNVNVTRDKQGETPLDITRIPMDDTATFDLLKACATTAVFQLESRGMKDLIRRLQPDNFEEITALVALFRPGPLQSGMVDDFIDRKHGRANVEYLHPDLMQILKPTYGVILYQEQVMQIAQVLAGYTLGGADMLRRAMGKKKVEEMAKQRAIFVEGAVKHQVDSKTAEHIFDLMEKFAGYGFNRSHSAAYALIAYQTAWLKAHYPAEFMAAVLSSDMDNTDKVVILLEECRCMKLVVVPPHVHVSQYAFSVNDKGEIVYGLGAIKGVGESAIQSILEKRDQAGDFRDLFDFCIRNDMRRVNRRVLEALIRAGAMDQLGPNRASMIASLEKAQKSADQALQNEQHKMRDLFAEEDDKTLSTHPDLFIRVNPWPEQVRLQGEKETLGRYVSGHPLKAYAAELKQLTSAPIIELLNVQERSVVCCGLITSVRFMQTKKAERMAILTIDDTTATLDIMVFPDAFALSREYLVKGELVAVEGDISIDNFSDSNKVIARRVMSLAMARAQYARRLQIKLAQIQCESQGIVSLQSILAQYQKPGLPVQVQYQREDFKVNVDLSAAWQVNPCDELIQKLEDLLGVNTVNILYPE